MTAAGSAQAHTPHAGRAQASQGHDSGGGPRAERRYRIGQTARIIGVSPSALRLWERQGLVSPSRTGGRYRVYSDADLDALRRVRRLRAVHKVNAPGIRQLLRTPGRAAPDATGPDGSRLRELRTRRGFSLRDAAAATDLSISFISALERGATGASVVALQRLTSAYGATMLDLFAAGSEGRVTRRRNRPVLELAGSGTRIEQLAAGAAQMEPQLFVLAPGASSEGAYSHDGEEFLFVLRGRLSIRLGEAEHYRLAPGDALYFPSTLLHRWRNESSAETRVLWINTPPTF